MKKYHKLGGKKLFYKKTGIYTDWAQIKKLPSIDTLVDIGVGVNGTPELYNHFNSAHLKPSAGKCIAHYAPIASGSSKVKVNGKGCGRVGDIVSGCTKVGSGSENVFAG